MKRYGCAIRLGGDAQIAAALGEGIALGTAEALTRTKLTIREETRQGDAVTRTRLVVLEQETTLPAEDAREALIRQRTQAALLRVAVGRCMGPEDYAEAIAEAERKYGQPERRSRLAAALWGLYGGIICGIRAYFAWFDRANKAGKWIA